MLYILGFLGYYSCDKPHLNKAGEVQITLFSLSHFHNEGEDSQYRENNKEASKTPKTSQNKTNTKRAQKSVESKKLQQERNSQAKDNNPMETALENTQQEAKEEDSYSQSVQSYASGADEIDAYMKYVYERIARAYMRSSALRDATIIGEVGLIFHIDTQGVIRDIHINKSSQDTRIDRVALSVLQSVGRDLKKPSKAYTMSVVLSVGKNNQKKKREE